MKFVGPKIVVEDITASREFYENIVGEVVKLDFGEGIQFESGLTLHARESMSETYHFRSEEISKRSNNCVLYFETDNFDHFMKRLRTQENIEYVNDVMEFNWGPQSICFYDPDEHPVDVSESMEAVCKRLLRQGASIEEVAEKTGNTIDFVRSCWVG